MAGRYDRIVKTRFTELGYTMIEPGCWQHIDLTGDEPHQVGGHYPTRAALVGDTERYASEFGCEGAEPRTQMPEVPNLNGIAVTRVKDTIFIPLPPELWRKAGDCVCPTCKADETGGYWDTLAVSAIKENDERTWQVHYPELHNQVVRRASRY